MVDALKKFIGKREDQIETLMEGSKEDPKKETVEKKAKPKFKSHDIVFAFNDSSDYRMSYDNVEMRDEEFDKILQAAKNNEYYGEIMGGLIIFKETLKYIKKEDVK